MCLVRHLADRCQSRAAHGADVTRSNSKPHDTVQKRGGNVQLRRALGFARGCDGTAVSVSSAVQVEVGFEVLCGNATQGASYQSSLVRGKMSTCAVRSSDALAGVRERGADKKGKRIGREMDQTSGGEMGRAAVNNERASVLEETRSLCLSLSLCLSFSCSSPAG